MGNTERECIERFNRHKIVKYRQHGFTNGRTMSNMPDRHVDVLEQVYDNQDEGKEKSYLFQPILNHVLT